MRQAPALKATGQETRPRREGLREGIRHWRLFASTRTRTALDAPAFRSEKGTAAWAWLTQIGRVARPLVFTIPFVQVLALLWVIWTRTPTAPYWDEWVYVNLVKHANEGTLTFNDFWALHFYTHRIVIPRLIDLSLIELTHWNRQVMMTFDLALGVASGGLVFASMLRSLKSRNAALALVIPLSLLVLSWSQYENWLEPFQVAFIATAFGVFICVFALQTEPMGWRRFSLAVLGALIATFSSAAGLMVWVAFVPSMARAGLQRLLAWTGIALLVWTTYLQGFTNHFTHPSLSAGSTFVLAYLGAPVAYPHVLRSLLVGLFGVVMLVTNAVVYWRIERSLGAILVWVELALYAVATAALTASGRGMYGAAGGVTSRYQVFGALFWIATIIVGAMVLQLAGRRLAAGKIAHGRTNTNARILLAANVIVLLAIAGSCVFANRTGLRTGKAEQGWLQQHQHCIAHYETAPDSCLALWFPLENKQAVLEAAAYLKAQKLAIFYDSSR